MRQLAYISLIMALVASVGCKTTRKSVQSTEVKTDSLRNDSMRSQQTNTNKDVEKTKIIIERDTAVGIPGANIADTAKGIKVNDIPRTINGKAVPQHFEKKEKGVRAWVKIDTNGRVLYGCEVDSYTLVIKNLIRENTILRERYDSLAYTQQHTNKQRVSTEQKTTEVTIVKERTWWGRNWRWIVGLIVAIIALIIVGNISGFFKRYRL